LVLGLCSLPSKSWSEPPITQHQCENASFDYTSRFGSDTFIGVTEFCWVHAVAALLEEHTCLSQPKLCHQNISRSAVAAISNLDKPILINKLKMGSIHKTLRNVLNHGRICLKKYSVDPESETFNKVQSKSSLLFSAFNSIETKKLTPEQLKEEQIRSASLMQSIQEILNQDKPETADSSAIPHLNSKKLTSYFKQAKAKFPDDEEFQNGFFFQRVLLSNCDGNNLILFQKQPQDLIQKDFYFEKEVEVRTVVKAPAHGPKELKTEKKKERFPQPDSNLNRLTELTRAKSSGRSSIFEVCARDLSLSLQGFNVLTHFGYSDEMCGGHAVVINGARWNSQNKRCELHMQNFWGNSAQLLPTHWYDADSVLQSTIRIHFINPN
jgi:hypothetical protein